MGYGRINAYRALSGAPAVPLLSAPHNNSITAYNCVTLQWDTATWATSYHLQVDNETTFTSPLVKDVQSIAATQWTDTYSPNDRYYWRICAINDSVGEWSVVWSFVAGTLPIPQLVSPSNEMTEINPNMVMLQWSSAPCANSYGLQVSLNDSFSSLLLDLSNIEETSYDIGPLQYSTRYYWRVNSTNDSGTSDWSAAWWFETKPPNPSITLSWVPALSCTQGCNPKTSDCNPRLTWVPQNGATGPYDIFRYWCEADEGDCGSPAQLIQDNYSSTCYVDPYVTVVRPGQEVSVVFYYYIKGNSGAGPQSNKVAVNTHMIWKAGMGNANENIPTTTHLIGNYPNPFNPSTTISYELAEVEYVTLIIYDILGRKVATLVNEYQTTGSKSVELIVTNLESGFYFYRLTAGKYTEMKKMLLIK